MTDGEENSSKKYRLETVREMIKHQEEKYNWSFIYMGTDLDSLEDADSLGITKRSVSSRGNIVNNYEHINTYAAQYRLSDGISACAEVTLATALREDTIKYSTSTGISLK